MAQMDPKNRNLVTLLVLGIWTPQKIGDRMWVV